MPDHRALNFRRPLSRFSLLGTALLLAFGTSAQAQSLQAVYEAARSYDATYLAARALAESAQGRAMQADSTMKPKVGVGISEQHQNYSVPFSTEVPDPANPGGTMLVSGRASLSGDTVTAGFNGSWALYNRANKIGADQAQRGLLAAQADLVIADQDLIVRVAQAYFDVLAAKDALGTTRTSRAAIAEQLASAKRNFEVGTATITDTREAQARFDLARAAEIAADNDLRSKNVTLDQLVGRVGVTPSPLAVPVALPAVMPTNVEPWVERATAEHPQIRKAQIGYDVAHLETQKARAGNSVTVDLTGNAGLQRAWGSAAELSTGVGTTRSATLTLSVNLPLYTGGFVQGRVMETLALEEKSRNDLDFARRSVEESTRRAFLGVESLTAQVSALEAAESSSQLALDATKLGYKVGVRVNLDVLNAQTQLFTTQRDLAKARYDVLVNSLRLRQASGQLTASDVIAINQLLAR